MRISQLERSKPHQPQAFFGFLRLYSHHNHGRKHHHHEDHHHISCNFPPPYFACLDWWILAPRGHHADSSCNCSSPPQRLSSSSGWRKPAPKLKKRGNAFQRSLHHLVSMRWSLGLIQIPASCYWTSFRSHRFLLKPPKPCWSLWRSSRRWSGSNQPLSTS